MLPCVAEEARADKQGQHTQTIHPQMNINDVEGYFSIHFPRDIEVSINTFV
jgi:hypothetical protein